MKRALVIFLVFLTTVSIAYSAQRKEPYADFTLLKCDDFGVLSFKADYQPNGYKGSYNIYLPSVKVKTTLDGKTSELKGQWYRFDNKQFLTSEIKLSLPTAYFFSNQESLKKGTYEVAIDYAVRSSGYERFKKQFLGSVSCPTTRYEFEKEIEVSPKEEGKEEPVEETSTTVEKPPMTSEEPNYKVYYTIGIVIAFIILLTIIFFAGVSLTKRIHKAARARKKHSPQDVARLFEKKD